MFNKILIILLVLTGFAYAENGWSEPVLIYSAPMNFDIDFVLDKNDNFHLLWSHGWRTEPANRDTGIVLYSKSYDYGETWSTPEEISQKKARRYAEPTGAFDSHNNLHVAYASFYGSKVYYRKHNGVAWEEEEFTGAYTNTDTRILCDSNNRIYILGNGSESTCYQYRSNDQWTVFKEINDTLDMPGYHVLIDQNNNLHLFGKAFKNGTRAYHCMYDRNLEKWTDFTDLSNNMLPSSSRAGVISKPYGLTPKLETVISAGNYSEVSSSYYMNSTLYSNTWTQPQKINETFNIFDKRIVIDQNEQPHIFDLTSDYHKLYHFYLVDGQWQYQIVFNDSIDRISKFDVKYANNKIFLLYKKTNSQMYIINKTIPTSINTADIKPQSPALYSYPNPFNSSTVINWHSVAGGETELAVYNAKGELVKSLFKGKKGAGLHSITFNATTLNSGVYYCRLKTGREVKTTKLMLLK